MGDGYHLADFGAYTVGGRMIDVAGRATREINFTPTASFIYDPNGTFAIEHLYVQYFVPASRNAQPPILLLHGGGLTGSTWETTPDGRPGWLHGLLRRGFEVHVVDNVERGRAGWCAIEGIWPDVPIQRSLQEAWTLFRFGRPAEFDARKPFPGQRFPISALDTFARSFVPRWTSTGPAASAAFEALIDRFEQVAVISHSQGGQFAFEAAASRPGRISALCAIEPSGFTNTPEVLRGVPVLMVHGDFLDCDERWQQMNARWRAWADALAGPDGDDAVTTMSLPREGIRGNSHMVMMDDNSDVVLERVVEWLDGVRPR